MKAFTNVLAAVMFAVFSLASCFFPPTARNSFAEGRYLYEGETVHFYEDLYIEELYMDLYLAEEYTPVEVGETNLITNRKDKLTYTVDLEIKFAGRDFERFTVQSLPNPINQPDCYFLVMDVSPLNLGDDVRFEMFWVFKINETTSEKSFSIDSTSLYIGDEEKQQDSFPQRITLMQLDKEE